VIHMLRHFHAAGCRSDQIFRYRIYGHYNGDQHKSVDILTDDFLKTNFLTCKNDKVEHRVHEELGITDPQLATFRSLLEIDVNALSYDAQQNKLLKLIESKIPSCTPDDAKDFYYPSDQCDPKTGDSGR
jgi:hypothetical protein